MSKLTHKLYNLLLNASSAFGPQSLMLPAIAQGFAIKLKLNDEFMYLKPLSFNYLNSSHLLSESKLPLTSLPISLKLSFLELSLNHALTKLKELGLSIEVSDYVLLEKEDHIDTFVSLSFHVSTTTSLGPSQNQEAHSGAQETPQNGMASGIENGIASGIESGIAIDDDFTLFMQESLAQALLSFAEEHAYAIKQSEGLDSSQGIAMGELKHELVPAMVVIDEMNLTIDELYSLRENDALVLPHFCNNDVLKLKIQDFEVAAKYFESLSETDYESYTNGITKAGTDNSSSTLSSDDPYAEFENLGTTVTTSIDAGASHEAHETNAGTNAHGIHGNGAGGGAEGISYSGAGVRLGFSGSRFNVLILNGELKRVASLFDNEGEATLKEFLALKNAKKLSENDGFYEDESKDLELQELKDDLIEGGFNLDDSMYETKVSEQQEALTIDSLNKLPIKVDLVLERLELPLGEVKNLKAGSALSLNEHSLSHIKIYAQGRLVGTGKVVELDGAYAVQVKELFLKE